MKAPATKPFRADPRASQARAEDGNLPTLREPFSPCGSAAAHELAPEWLGQISGRSGIPGSGPGPEHDTAAPGAKVGARHADKNSSSACAGTMLHSFIIGSRKARIISIKFPFLQPHTHAAAVLRNEFNSGIFEGALHGLNSSRRHGFPRSAFRDGNCPRFERSS